MAKRQYIIAIPVYDGVDLMDIAAPREMFNWSSSEIIDLVVYYIGEASETDSKQAKPIVTRDGLTIIPDVTYQNEKVQQPDLIWVPGGAPDSLSVMIKDPNCKLINYVKNKGPQAEWVTSVCEGAILLASTGLLNGYHATTHHSFYLSFSVSRSLCGEKIFTKNHG